MRILKDDIKLVKSREDVLINVKYQTKTICLESVRLSGRSLGDVLIKNQTPEMCLEAVKEDGMALKYVWNQTVEICIAAIKQNLRARRYVAIKL
jgi:hypothetical protein